MPEGPAVEGEFVGATYAFHEGGDDARGSGEADQNGDDKGVGGSRAVRRIDEVALQERADVGRKDTVEEDGELGAERGGVGHETDECGSNDERWEERDHGRVGGGLSEVETVVPRCTNQRAVEDARKPQESSYGICPRVGHEGD